MATYELKFQLSDGSEVIAGTFTVPAGGGGGGNVLNLDFVNSKHIITETEFAKFKDPSLVIWGYYIDPAETGTGKTSLRLDDMFYDNDTAYEIYYFRPQNGNVRLEAGYDSENGEYYYKISGGYVPYGTTLHFTIDGVSEETTDAYTWQEWVNTQGGQGWFISATEDGDNVVSSDEGTAYSWLVDSNENKVFPTDSIIDGEAYTTYAP